MEANKQTHMSTSDWWRNSTRMRRENPIGLRKSVISVNKFTRIPIKMTISWHVSKIIIHDALSSSLSSGVIVASVESDDNCRLVSSYEVSATVSVLKVKPGVWAVDDWRAVWVSSWGVVWFSLTFVIFTKVASELMPPDVSVRKMKSAMSALVIDCLIILLLKWKIYVS